MTTKCFSMNIASEWMDSTFHYWVRVLIDLSNYLGLSYEEINVWIFLIIHPLITLALFYLWVSKTFVR
jgi:hypothetical protein